MHLSLLVRWAEREQARSKSAALADYDYEIPGVGISKVNSVGADSPVRSQQQQGRRQRPFCRRHGVVGKRQKPLSERHWMASLLLYHAGNMPKR